MLYREPGHTHDSLKGESQDTQDTLDQYMPQFLKGGALPVCRGTHGLWKVFPLYP